MNGIAPGTWVVVADSEKALFLENVGEADHPHFRVRRKKEQENPPHRDQAANRPGRYHDSGPNQKSAHEETDFHELAKDRFASELAEMLYHRAHNNLFSKLILDAAPEVLGALRKEMHKTVVERVIAEVPKALTHVPLDQLEERLAKDVGQG